MAEFSPQQFGLGASMGIQPTISPSSIQRYAQPVDIAVMPNAGYFQSGALSPEVLQRYYEQQIQPANIPVERFVEPQMQQAAPVQQQSQQIKPDQGRLQYAQLIEQRFNELANKVGGVENVLKYKLLDQFRSKAAQDVDLIYGKPEIVQPMRVESVEGVNFAIGPRGQPMKLPTQLEQQAEELGLKKSLLDLQRAEQDLRLTQQKAQTEGLDRALKLQSSLTDSAKAIGMIDELLYDPALASGVGVKSWLSILPETKALQLKSKIDQIKGDVFMRVYEGLKGGGQITEIESAKASKSKERLDPKLSVDDFKDALLDLRKTYMDFTGMAAKGLQAFAPQAQQQVAPQAQVQQPQTQSLPPPSGIPNDGRPIISVEPPTPGQPVVIPQLPPEPMQITKPDGSVSVPKPSGIRWTRDASGKPVMVPRG